MEIFSAAAVTGLNRPGWTLVFEKSGPQKRVNVVEKALINELISTTLLVRISDSRKRSSWYNGYARGYQVSH
jgi:hypothetical protein